MANYETITVSNSVKVKSRKEVIRILDEFDHQDEIEANADKGDNKIDIGSYGEINMWDMEETIQDLQDQLEDGEVLCVHSIGHEKLNQIHSDAWLISNKQSKYINFNNILEDEMKKMKEEDKEPKCTSCNFTNSEGDCAIDMHPLDETSNTLNQKDCELLEKYNKGKEFFRL